MFKLLDDVVLTESPDGAYIVDLQRDSYLKLNESGYVVLTKLLHGSTPEDIARDLSTQFGREFSAVLSSLAGFIQRAKEIHILSEVEN